MWRRQWHPTPGLLPGKFHGRRSLVGCSPWGHEESDMTERLHFHFSLLCIGKGNGNPLQCSCLENPRDGVAQSQTQLKWLSSSSSNLLWHKNYFCFTHQVKCEVKVTHTCVRLFATPWTIAIRLRYPWNSPGKNTRVGYHSLLQGIFSNQESNLSLPHCRQIANCLSPQGSPGFTREDPVL